MGIDNGAILSMLRLISKKEKSMETTLAPTFYRVRRFSQTPTNVTNPHDRTKPQLSQAEALFCVYSMIRKRGCVGISTHPLFTIRD